MDDSFRGPTDGAGAAPSILAALAAVKPPAQQAAKTSQTRPSPTHSRRRKLIKDKHYDEAADRINRHAQKEL